jgi:hypothetical protein
MKSFDNPMVMQIMRWMREDHEPDFHGINLILQSEGGCEYVRAMRIRCCVDCIELC